MNSKFIPASMIALLGMLMTDSDSRAQGRLQILGDDVPAVAVHGAGTAAATMTLQLHADNDADSLLTHGWWRFYWGYRPYYWWGYRPYYWWGYRPYYWNFYFSFGYPRYYYYPPIYYYPPSFYYYYYYYPISMSADAPASAIQRVEPQRLAGGPVSGTLTPVPGNHGPYTTYPYDGGPRHPVPMPTPGPNVLPPRPQTAPAPPTVPLEGTPISYPPPVAQKKYVYPGYGERVPPPSTSGSSFAQDRVVSTKK